MDCSPPGSSVPGILQVRILEWVAISFSRGSSWPRDGTLVSYIAGSFFADCTTREVPYSLFFYNKNVWKEMSHIMINCPLCIQILLCMRVLNHFSCVWLFANLWTVAHQAPLSMGFPRQEYWSGLLCLLPGHLPDSGIEPVSLTSPALTGRFFTTEPPEKPLKSS